MSTHIAADVRLQMYSGWQRFHSDKADLTSAYVRALSSINGTASNY